jgi:hypothetical protein
MSHLICQLWSDDCGALISTEFLFVATILVIGVIAGLVLVRDAVVVQLAQLACAIGALEQCFSFSGISACHVAVCGSATGPDTCACSTLTSAPPASVCPLTISPCF